MSTIDQPLPDFTHLRHPRPCLRCREREPGRLQLRVVLRPGEGVCEVLVDEDDDRVEVLVLVCGDAETGAEATDCPVHVYLGQALGDRRVVDKSRGGAKVEPFIPTW